MSCPVPFLVIPAAAAGCVEIPDIKKMCRRVRLQVTDEEVSAMMDLAGEWAGVVRQAAEGQGGKEGEGRGGGCRYQSKLNRRGKGDAPVMCERWTGGGPAVRRA